MSFKRKIISCMMTGPLLMGSTVIPQQGAGAAPAEISVEKPNILVLMSDQHNASVLGAYGDPYVDTPNIDSLAENGILFENCYTNCPICVPARLAFTSGQYISRINAWNNSSTLPRMDYPSIADTMNAAGYQSYLVGKMHYDVSETYGFKRLMGENSVDDSGVAKKQPGASRINITEEFLNTPGGRFTPMFEECGVKNSFINNQTENVTNSMVEFLKNRKAEDGPFFTIGGFIAPHNPFTIPQEYYDKYKNIDEIKEPEFPLPEDFLETYPKDYISQLRGYELLGPEDKGPDADDTAKYRALYYGLVDYFDDHIGTILDTLYSNPEICDNTIVVYTSDHGEQIGNRGFYWKSTMYEDSASVPLIVSYPKKFAKGERKTEVCTLIDLVQTIAQWGGTEMPEGCDGDSLAGIIDGTETNWRNTAVCEYYADQIGSGFSMFRKDNYKYIYFTKINEQYGPERQLFDLDQDPKETNNLADDPAYAQLVEEMHQALVQETGDPEEIEAKCRALMATRENSVSSFDLSVTEPKLYREGDNGQEVTQPSGTLSGTFSAKATVTNISDNSGQAVLAAALYDGGQLKELVMSPQTTAGPRANTTLITLPLHIEEAKPSHEIKTFVWDSMEGMTPITERVPTVISEAQDPQSFIKISATGTQPASLEQPGCQSAFVYAGDGLYELSATYKLPAGESRELQLAIGMNHGTGYSWQTERFTVHSDRWTNIKYYFTVNTKGLTGMIIKPLDGKAGDPPEILLADGISVTHVKNQTPALSMGNFPYGCSTYIWNPINCKLYRDQEQNTAKVLQAGDGSVILKPETASAAYSITGDGAERIKISQDLEALVGWQTDGDMAKWETGPIRKDTYLFKIDYANDISAPGQFLIVIRERNGNVVRSFKMGYDRAAEEKGGYGSIFTGMIELPQMEGAVIEVSRSGQPILGVKECKLIPLDSKMAYKAFPDSDQLVKYPVGAEGAAIGSTLDLSSDSMFRINKSYMNKVYGWSNKDSLMWKIGNPSQGTYKVAEIKGNTNGEPVEVTIAVKDKTGAIRASTSFTFTSDGIQAYQIPANEGILELPDLSGDYGNYIEVQKKNLSDNKTLDLNFIQFQKKMSFPESI